MHDIAELVDGYRAFRAGRYAEQAALYRALARRGQSPRTMIVACCDSRADPATIFNAGPGELFVVRNVANLVPPYEPDGDYHGTSAAIEFAVTGLDIDNIVVLGHGQCGGIAAFLDAGRAPASAGDFIGKWMSLLDSARAALPAPPGAGHHDHQRHVEHAAIRHSLDNLISFPFIRERVAAGRLRLRGGWFDIASGRLLAPDPATGDFTPVS
jgi:carbonic anhydrase